MAKTGEILLKQIESLLADESRLQKMKNAAKALGRPEAAEDIARKVLALLNK